VTREALRPFLTTGQPNEAPVLPHLAEPRPMHLDLRLEVGLRPEGGAERS
jgi:hypothetical protein